MALATNHAAAAASAALSGGAASQPRRATPSFLPLKRRTICAVHAAEPSKASATAAAAAKTSSATVAPEKSAAPAPKPAPPARWAIDSWRAKKALQLPEYPNAAELESALKTIEAFPPIVFAGEARNLEERLADAAMGRAFLLQGGDCAESFKEFNGNNIRDTFRVLLQMSAVLTFGGQMPVIKVPIHRPPQIHLPPQNSLIIRSNFELLIW
jgi:3-deoxy-7-phosphoheptulonate synthase